MADPFVAEIRMVGFTFSPLGWAACDGQVLPIAQNTALFSLLGTTFGGDGRTNFALPNIRARAPMNPGQRPGGSAFDLGGTGGGPTTTLTATTMPAHTHAAVASAAHGNKSTPQNNTWAVAVTGRQEKPMYGPKGNDAPMNPSALTSAGGGAAHNNMPPYLVLNFIIALQGIFPPRS